jgi:Fe-S-cluster-containing dehydrogenase component/formate-dependent nitrite reductase membrane component NrfD
MRFAFVIDQNRCIGCHACTVACKEEHNVPIGVNRTWVKYFEKGLFPTTRRHFAVLRCNHCSDAPCVTICPTVALFKRNDGIVDFDGSRCIGCKSCMQACPYDALYINPDSGTAAKCNFCAHRVETNLQPACEIVCPVQAIVSGDLDDAASRVNDIIGVQKTTVRKPDKTTKPNVYYVGVEQDLLVPTKIDTSESHLWAEKYPGEDRYTPPNGNGSAREVYDVPHPTPWGWKIGSYLWTKSIAAGVLLVAALLHLVTGDAGSLNTINPIVALLFTGLTTFLLVIDLKRPERFHYLLIKPNPGSWLVIGGYILIAYGLIATVWLGAWRLSGSVPITIIVVGVLLALASACYSAFLFAQARGRDLWQSRTFFWHLAAQALTAGAATSLICGLMAGVPIALLKPVAIILLAASVFALVLTLGEIGLRNASEDKKRAHGLMIHGALRGRFWALSVGLGMLLPVLILAGGFFRGEPSGFALVSASVFSLIGLWFYEDTWVKAGQAVPLS